MPSLRPRAPGDSTNRTDSRRARAGQPVHLVRRGRGDRSSPVPRYRRKVSSSAEPSADSVRHTLQEQFWPLMGAVVRQRTIAIAALLAGALLAVTGCGASTEGSAIRETTTDVATTETLWDPCTQISDDVLRQVGVDPTTRDNTISGVENVEGWKLCSWDDKASRWNYTLGVWSTVHTIEEIKGDQNNTDFTNISVGSRSGLQFRKVHDSHNEECYIALPTDGQSIEVSIYKTVSTRDGRDSCDIAKTAAELLVPIFPM